MARKTEALEFEPKYTYNREDDVYVINMKHLVKPFVIKGYKLRAIRRAISNSITPSDTASQICTKFKLLAKDLAEIKKVFDLTQDVSPLTDEEINEQTDEQSAAQILEERRAAISQIAEKESWKVTQKEAEQWRGFVNKVVDPVSVVLDSWVAPKVSPLKLTKQPVNKPMSDEVLVIGLSDLHYGSASNSRYMYNRPDWSTKKTVECVAKFAQTIIDTVSKRNYQFKKVVILGLGDLLHSLNGKTARGTELIYDVVREEQFEYALSSLSAFIQAISSVIPIVDVHSVYGNHNYEAEMALFRALDQFFTPYRHIKFYHYSSRPAAFREGETLFLLDHGADSIEKAYVPTGSDTKIQIHVQSLLLSSKPELVFGARERLFVMGDKHHWEHVEYNDFQFIMFGTVLGGDQHASVNNLKNRPRQSYLVINEAGLKEVGHCYFDGDSIDLSTKTSQTE